MPRGRVTGPAPGTSAAEDCAYCDCTGRDIKVEIPATPLEPPDRSTPVLSAFICVHQRPLWGFGFRVGPEEKHIWLSLSGRSVQNRGARDCLRPGSASPLARRGSPSGLQYGYARILRLSLSFSRLSTFVPHAQVYMTAGCATQKWRFPQRDLRRRIAAPSVLSAFIFVHLRPDMLFLRPNAKIETRYWPQMHDERRWNEPYGSWL